MTRVKTSRGKSEVELATLCLSRRSETREAGATGRSLIHALRNDSSLVTDRCGAVRVAVTRGFELKRQPTFLVAYRDAIAFHRPRFATDIACKAHERNADIFLDMVLPGMRILNLAWEIVDRLKTLALNIHVFLMFHESEIKGYSCHNF